MNIGLEHSAAWIPLVILGSLIGALLLYYYREERRKWTKTIKGLLFSLRLVMLLLIGFLLLQPFISIKIDEVEKPILLIFQDKSASVPESDVSKVNAWIASLEDAFDDRFDIQHYGFADEVFTDTSAQEKGLNTDIGKIYSYVNESFQGANIGAIVIATDGIINQGNDPRYQAMGTDAPLYSILLGDTATKIDAAVADLKANKLAFLGNDFEIRTRIDAVKLKGDRIKVKLLQNGMPTDEQIIGIQDLLHSAEVSFLVNAKTAGTFRYTVQVDSIAGEKNTANNTKDVYVEVLDNRTKVQILLKAPHPDAAAIKQAIEKNEQYEVALTLMKDWDGLSSTADLFILHGLPSNAEDLKRLKVLVNDQKQIFSVITADVSLTHFNALNLGVSINTTRNQRDEAGAWINKEFNLFNVPDNNQLRRFPPLMVPFGEVNLKANAQIALNQTVGSINTPQPFLLFTEQDGLKHGVLLAEGWWRWRLFNSMLDEPEIWTDVIIQKTVQYLAIKQKRTRLAVNVPAQFIESEDVEFEAEYYNPSFELSAEAAISLNLINPAGESFQFLFKPAGNSFTLNLGTLAPGEYKWRAEANAEAELFEQTGVFEVLENRAEYQQTVAQHGLMSFLTEQQYGKAYELSAINQLNEQLNQLETAKPVIHSSDDWMSLIDWKTMLYLMAFLVSLEWFLRKFNGYV